MNLEGKHLFALAILLGVASSGCARDGRQITPTTTGTDLQAMPRGRMTPLPFPGSSLARSSSSSNPKADPAASTASLEGPDLQP